MAEGFVNINNQFRKGTYSSTESIILAGHTTGSGNYVECFLPYFIDPSLTYSCTVSELQIFTTGNPVLYSNISSISIKTSLFGLYITFSAPNIGAQKIATVQLKGLTLTIS